MSKNKKSERSENIQVVVRCRPMSKNELTEKQFQVCAVNEKDKEVTITLQMKSNKPSTKTFCFDGVYGPKSTQRDIYMGTVYPIVQEVLEGYNCTLFAYGQTGTGKTYTMEGSRDDPSKWSSTEAGIIARSINTIFETLAKCDDYSVKISILELYNEELCDLLNPENKNLKIYEDPSSTTSTITVHNLTEIPVYNSSDIFTILEKSYQERKTAETDLNDGSSRSHCIFSITICIREMTPEGEELLKIGKLNLVDLAGSENVGKSGVKNQSKTETGMINKSLLTLGRVINALTEHSPHVPYRESKLTRLLQDSLGGATKTCIIATISPASGGSDETLSTLDYACRAKNIRNLPQVNKKICKKEALKEFTTEISELRAQLDAARRKDGVFMPVEQFNKLTADLEEKTNRITQLEDEKESKIKELDEIQEIFQRQSTDLVRSKANIEELTDNLQKQTENLKQTEMSLVTTRTELKEAKVVLSEFKDTENQFHNEAEVILNTLSSCLEDVQKLHQKISREDNIHEYNRLYLDRFKTKVAEKIVSMKDDISKFVSYQKNKYTLTSSQLENFLEVHQKDIEKQLVVTNANYQALSEGLTKLKEMTLSTVSTHELYRQQIVTYHSNTAKNLESKSTTLYDNFQGNKKTVESQLQQYCDKSKVTNRGNLCNLEETNIALKNWVETHGSDINGLYSYVSNKVSTGLEKLNEQSTQLSQLIQSQKEIEMKQQKEMAEFMQRHTKQMEEFMKQQNTLREQLNNQAISKLKEDLATNITGFIQANQSLKENSSALQNRVRTLGEAVINRNNSVLSQIAVSEDSLNQFSSQLSESLNNTSTTLTSDLKTLCIGTVSDLKNCDTLLEDCHNALTRKEQDYSELHISLGYRAHEFNHSLSNSIKSTDTRTTETVKTCLSEIKVSSDDTINFGSGHYNHIGQFQEGIFTFAYKPYISSGETPLKKSYDYPQKLTHSRPEFEIINSYRQSLSDPNLTEPITPESPTPSPPSPSEIEIPSPDHTRDEPTSSQPISEAPTRSSLPTNKSKVMIPAVSNRKSNEPPGGRSSVIPVVNPNLKNRNSNNNNNNKTEITSRRKVSMGGKSNVSSSLENSVLSNKSLGQVGKERHRLGDLTNQVNKT